ncbi:MAG: hypothetical protein GX765_04915 [Candidatus Moranbacteria bacterium]|nr:hypothetical protein [Candidatus Moranbacteria bacterium]
MKKISDKKIIFAVLIILIFSVFFVYKYIWSKYNYAPPVKVAQDIEKINSGSEAVTPEKNSTLGNNEYESDHCFLRKKTSQEDEIIFDNQDCTLSVSNGGDYLFFTEGNGYRGEDVVLYAYSIKTGEKIKIYSIDEDARDYKEKPRDIYIGEIFDNAFFFSAGGYMTDQIIYSLNLSDVKSKPKSISSDSLYYEINYSDGHYWIAGGFGDAGVSATKRALFDIDKQKIIGREIETSNSFGFGTSYLGADENSAFIASFDGGQDLQFKINNEEDSTLSEIYSLDLMKNKTPKTIISKKSMPSNISKAVYMYDKRNIVLLGNDAYVYNLEKEELRKIISLKDVKFSWSNEVFGDAVCLTEELKLDVEKKVILSDKENCTYERKEYNEELEEKIKSFNLPPEYDFVIERR